MSWKEQLSDEYKEAPAFKDIGDDINDLAKNYLDTQSYLGNAIRVPGEDASDADRAAFYEKLQKKAPNLIPTPDFEKPETIDPFLKAFGKPEKPDEYELPAIDGVDIEEEHQTLMRQTAHELGMTKKQLSGFLEKVFSADAAKQEIVEHQQQEAIQGLKSEWGVTYKDRMEALKKGLLLTEAPAELTEALKNDRMPTGVVKWLHSVFEKFNSEGTELTDTKDTIDKDLVDVAEAQARVTEIRNKMTGPNAPAESSPEYKALLDKLLKYERMAHPQSSNDINDLRAGLRSA